MQKKVALITVAAVIGAVVGATMPAWGDPLSFVLLMMGAIIALKIAVWVPIIAKGDREPEYSLRSFIRGPLPLDTKVESPRSLVAIWCILAFTGAAFGAFFVRAYA